MTGVQMRYYNLNAGAEANFALKVRLALSIIHNYENGNSKNYSHSEYMECSKFIQNLEPQILNESYKHGYVFAHIPMFYFFQGFTPGCREKGYIQG